MQQKHEEGEETASGARHLIVLLRSHQDLRSPSAGDLSTDTH